MNSFIKTIKIFLILAVFFVFDYTAAMANVQDDVLQNETSACINSDSIAENGTSKINASAQVYAPAQVNSDKRNSDKIAEIETLIQKVLEAQKSPDHKRAGIVVIKELIKLVWHVIGRKLFNMSTLSSEAGCMALDSMSPALFLVLDKFAYNFACNNDQILNSLKNLERKLTTLNSEQKVEYAKQFKGKYSDLLSNKINKEKDLILVYFGYLITMFIDLNFLGYATRFPLLDSNNLYEGSWSIDEAIMFLYDFIFSPAYNGEITVKSYNPATNTFGLPKTKTFSASERLLKTSCGVLIILNLCQIFWNLCHNPSSERARVLARIEKTLSL